MVNTVNGIGQVTLRLYDDSSATPVETKLAKRVIHRNNKIEVVFEHKADAYLGDGNVKVQVVICSQRNAVYFADLHLAERNPIT